MGLFSKYSQSLTTSENQHCYLPSFKTPSPLAWVMLMPSSCTSSSSEFFIITVISCPLHKNFQCLPFPLGLNTKMYDDLQGSFFLWSPLWYTLTFSVPDKLDWPWRLTTTGPLHLLLWNPHSLFLHHLQVCTKVTFSMRPPYIKWKPRPRSCHGTPNFL